jgi:hypothetical protein
MTLNLPPDIEAIAKEKALQAGLADVESFVLRIIENVSPEQALLPPPSDPRIIAAINDGFASGMEGEMDDAFWQERADKLESYISAHHGPAA